MVANKAEEEESLVDGPEGTPNPGQTPKIKKFKDMIEKSSLNEFEKHMALAVD
jgi:hypothetical protein